MITRKMTMKMKLNIIIIICADVMANMKTKEECRMAMTRDVTHSRPESLALVELSFLIK